VTEDEAEAILTLADEVGVGIELAADPAALREDWRVRYAAERIVERIFQAASILPETLQQRNFGDAGFRSLRGMRNRLAHNYLDIDEAILWESISIELPAVHERVAPDATHARRLIDQLLAKGPADLEAWERDHLGPTTAD
jgi:uncharacterized protein with HEPN domain